MQPVTPLQLWSVRVRNRAVATLWLWGGLLGCEQELSFTPEPVDINPDDVTPCAFEDVPGTKFSAYTCNPVLVGTDEPWLTSISTVGFRTQMVLGHPWYQLWYVGEGPNGWGLGYAVSDNGIDWSPHPTNPVYRSNEPWTRDGASTLHVAFDPGWQRYVMSYQAYELDTPRFGIGVATSVDGVVWDRHPDNPVLDLGENTANGQAICWPLSLTATETGLTGMVAARPNGGEYCQPVGVDIASPGQWSVTTAPVFDGQVPAYETGGVASAAEVELDGIRYLFYVAFDGWNVTGQTQSPRGLHLALATSVGGGPWIRHPDNPIRALSNAVDGEVSAVAAQVVGSRIHVWLTDRYADLDRSAVGYFLYDPQKIP